MNIIGTLYRVLPVEEVKFAGEEGARRTLTFVIQTDDSYSRFVAFRLWGEEKIATIKNTELGTKVSVTFSAKSRESQRKPGSYFTDLNCIAVEYFVSQPPNPKPSSDNLGTELPKDDIFAMNSEEETPF